MGIKVPCGGFELGGGLSFQNGVVTNGVKTLRLLRQQVSGGDALLSIMSNSDIQKPSDLKTTDLITAEIYTQYQEEGVDITQRQMVFSALPYTTILTQGWNTISIYNIGDSIVHVGIFVLKIDKDASSTEDIVFSLTQGATTWNTSGSST